MSQELLPGKLQIFSLRSTVLLGLYFALIAIAWIASAHSPQMWPRSRGFQRLRVHLWAGRVVVEYADVSAMTVAEIDSRFQDYGRNPLLNEKGNQNTLRQKIFDAYGTFWTTEATFSFPRASSRNLFGFTYIFNYSGFYVFVIPVWSFALLPLGWMTWQWLRHGRYVRRLNAGLCSFCGYDLRATPQCCPECGTDSEANLSGLATLPASER